MASIHGEAARLSRLYDRMAGRFGERNAIVYLGNYLGRGGKLLAAAFAPDGAVMNVVEALSRTSICRAPADFAYSL